MDPATWDYVAVALTEESVSDGEMLPQLLAQLEEQDLTKAYGDGAYDTHECYYAIVRHHGEAVIPPRRDAAYWASGHPRNQAVTDCRKKGRGAWKRDVGYHRRSLAETAVYRFKQLIGSALSARVPDNQGTEAYMGIAVIQRMNTLGMPIRA